MNIQITSSTCKPTNTLILSTVHPMSLPLKIKTEPAENASENQLPVDEDRVARKQKPTTLFSELPPPSAKAAALDGAKDSSVASSEVSPSDAKREQSRSGSQAQAAAQQQHPLRESQTSRPARDESEQSAAAAAAAAQSPLASVLIELKAERPLPGPAEGGGSSVITLAEGQVCEVELNSKVDSLQSLCSQLGLTASLEEMAPGKAGKMAAAAATADEARERAGDLPPDKKRRRRGDGRGDGGDSSKRLRLWYPEVARGG